MRIRDNKGITMVTLVITIIILAILAYTSVRIGISLTQEGKYQSVQTNLLLIKTECEKIANDKAIGEEVELYGQEITDSTSEYVGWYKLSQAELNEMGIKDAKAADGYFVNYNIENTKDVDVAYGKGVMHDDHIYYNLSDILKSGNEKDD